MNLLRKFALGLAIPLGVGLVVLLVAGLAMEPQHQAAAAAPGNPQQVVYVHDNNYDDFFLWMWVMNMHSGVYGMWHPDYYSRTYVINHYHYTPTAQPRSTKPPKGCALGPITLVGFKSNSGSGSSRPATGSKPSTSKPSTSKPNGSSGKSTPSKPAPKGHC